MTYESWRISYQSSEAAARSAWQEMIRLHHRVNELEAQLSAIGAGGVEPLRKPAAALHEEAIAEIVSASHDQAEFGERAINFLRDFQHLEYGTKLYPAPQAVQAAVPEAIEQMAADRYKVVPSHESMFHRWAVVAGNGTQQLYIGREVECLNMARKFSGAFLDGAFVAMQNTATAHPAEGVPAQVVELEVDDLIDRLLNAQQDLNLAANVHMDQSIASASTLLDEVEIALRTLADTQPAAQGMDAQTLKHISALSELVRMPNAEHFADAHNAAVRHLRALAAQAKHGEAQQ